MSRLTQKPAVAGLDLFQQINVTSTTAANYDPRASTYLGERFESGDGREFTMCSVGVVDLAAGVLVQGSAIVPNHQNLAVTATAAGAVTVNVTLGATATTANQYAGGFMIVNAGPGIGQTLKIASNPVIALSVAGNITLEDPIVTALTTSSKVCLIANPFSGIVINPTTPTATPVGVTLYPISASGIGLVQSKGIVSCLADGTIAVSSAISPSNGVAGAVEAGVIAQGFVGRALQAGVDQEARTVYVDM